MLVIHYIHSWYHMTILQELADFEKNSATIFIVFMVKHGKTSEDVARHLAFGNESSDVWHTAPKGGGAAVDIQPVDMYILHMFINIWYYTGVIMRYA